jgi:hypothetical protein
MYIIGCNCTQERDVSVRNLLDDTLMKLSTCDEMGGGNSLIKQYHHEP